MQRRILKSLSTWMLALPLAVGASGFGAEAGKDAPALDTSKPLTLSGYTQLLYTGSREGMSGFTIKKARVAITGDLLKFLRYKLQIDAVRSPILVDAQVEFVLDQAANFRVGQFKVPFSQENLASSADVDTVSRSQSVLKLVPGQDIGSLGRDIGAIFFGKTSIVEYTLGVFNGSGINRADTNRDKDLAARIVFRPSPLLSFGASAYDGRYSATDGVIPVKRDRAGLEAAFHYGPMSLKGEFIMAADGETTRRGWYTQAGYYFLPKKIQGILKFDSYDPNIRAPLDRSDLWTLGLNYFLEERTKLVVNLEVYRDETGRSTNSILLAMFQLAF